MKKTSITIALLTSLFFIAGAYTPPASDFFNSSGVPTQNTLVVPVSTEGASQVKEGGFATMKTFQARGNARFKDAVRIGGVLYGGNETSPSGSTTLSIGKSGVEETALYVTSNVVSEEDLRTRALESTSTNGYSTGLLFTCSNEEGFIVLCDEDVVITSSSPVNVLSGVCGQSTLVYTNSSVPDGRVFSGMLLFYDSALTSPYNEPTVTDANSGNIFNMVDNNGFQNLVGQLTGNSC